MPGSFTTESRGMAFSEKPSNNLGRKRSALGEPPPADHPDPSPRGRVFVVWLYSAPSLSLLFCATLVG